jgi:excisionase family DNA binding protein
LYINRDGGEQFTVEEKCVALRRLTLSIISVNARLPLSAEACRMDVSTKRRPHVNEEPAPYDRRVAETEAETDSNLAVSCLQREIDGRGGVTGSAAPSFRNLPTALRPKLPRGRRDQAAPEAEALDRVLVPLAVSPRKAAQYLDVGHDAIYQLLNQGRLRSVKLGRRRLIPMTELQRFLSDELA